MALIGNSKISVNNFEPNGLPRLPEIPQIQFCLHFPWTESWNNHWADFNRKVKEFHQSMIDFNWKMLEWYALITKQLERVRGVQYYTYIAGSIVTYGRVTIISSKAVGDGHYSAVVSEIRKCLPGTVREYLKELEMKGFKLCLVGKVFVFDRERVVVIDYDHDSEKTLYRNCLKFTLFHRNEKVNISEAYRRVYGGLKYSFIIGGIGGLIVSLLTGYFGRPPVYARRYITEQSLIWLGVKRFLCSSLIYTLLERVLLLKFPHPEKYLLSGSAGFISGSFFGFCDECDTETILCGATEYGIFSFLCNAVFRNQQSKGTIGCCAESSTFKQA